MIIRINKTENYSVICNTVFRDPRISARAKGLYAYIMTLPDNWKLHKKELYEHFPEGREAINKAWKELVTVGIISKAPHRLKDGTLRGWDILVQELPAVLLESRTTESPSLGRPAPTKYLSVLSTNNTNTNDREEQETEQSDAPASAPEHPPKDNPTIVEYSTDTMAAIQKAWQARTGGVPPNFGRIRKALRPLAAMERYEDKAVLDGFARYLSSTPPPMVSVERFCSTAGEWCESRRPATARPRRGLFE